MTQQLRNTNPPFPKNSSTHHKAEPIAPTQTHTHAQSKRDMGLLTMAKGSRSSTNTNTGTSSSSSSSDNRDMGLLLVFFPQHNNNNTISDDKTKVNFPSPSKSPTSTFKRTNSNNLILTKTQSTISICILLLFFTLLLFTLSTFEPTIPNNTPPPRRFLLHKPPTLHIIPNNNNNNNNNKPKNHNWLLKLWPNKSRNVSNPSHALQKMGTLYRRGTRSMTELIICHVADDTTEHDFRLFLRLIHRSGITAKTDVVFLFASPSSSTVFAPIIHQENDAFSSLVEFHSEANSTHPEVNSSFDLTRFYFNKKTEIGEPLWGKRIRSNFSNVEEREGGGGDELLSYGSVLSFDATELDSENSLAGFLDRVPLSLRRWACYPMLLGRVRHNFKHVMLVEVKNMLVLNDPFGRVRNRSPESVFLFSKHDKKNSRRVNSAVLIGGTRGVRRLCNTVVVEIVRAAMQHKKKNSVSDSVVLSQLVANEFTWKSKNVNLIASAESIPEASSLVGRNSGTATSLLSYYAIIQRGGTNNHDLDSILKKEICSSVVDSSVYRDC